MTGRRSDVAEELAQLLCLMHEEDTAAAIHGDRKAIPQRRHWETIAEFMRDGYRQDARRILRFLRTKLTGAHWPALTDDEEESADG